MTEPDWRAAGDRVEALLAASAAGAAGGAVARERAEELVRLVADLYGAGLERMLDLAHEHGALSGDLLDALAADDLVASLLLVHGLHPYPAATRIARAVAAQGGGVEVLAVGADGVVRLRMPAAGCSSAVVEAEVRDAIEAAAPEVTAIEVEQPATGVIPVSALFARLDETSGAVT